jgi:hypothetical protein
MSLTMRNPDFTGIVLDAHCIDKDRKVHSVNGYVTLPKK